MTKHLIDTNALINNPSILYEYENPVIPYPVLFELDSIKQEESERGYKSRETVRNLKELGDSIEYFVFEDVEYRYDKNDDKIIDIAATNGFTLVTGDYLMQLKAKAVGVDVVDVDEVSDENNYPGYEEVSLTDEELANFYENLCVNHFNLNVNQYLVIRDLAGEVVQGFRWDGYTHDGVKNKTIKSNIFGNISPLDVYQQFVIDSLYHNQMTMVKGKAGSGKSLLALAYSMSMIEKGKYDKLVLFVNPLNARNSARLGFYKGTVEEKLLQTAVGSMLSSKFGDKLLVQSLMSQNKLVLLPFADIRGYDTTGMRAIVHIIESQNLSVDLMKLALQRVGEDGKLIIDGDYNAQVDSTYYEGMNNGMRRVSEVFRGEEIYGEVELPNIYRSRIAQIAEKM